jgi:hypothetical protein
MVCENVGATWLPFRPFAIAKSNSVHRESEEAIWCSDGDWPAVQQTLDLSPSEARTPS